MLDDLRNLLQLTTAQRARVYLVAAGWVALGLTVFQVDLEAEGAPNAAMCLALAVIVLALNARAKSPAPVWREPLLAPPADTDSHNWELATRNLAPPPPRWL